MKKEMLIDSLVEKGWFHQEGFLDPFFCLELIAESTDIEWKKAQIGRGGHKALVEEIRNDSIHWLNLEEASEKQKIFLDKMHELQLELNRELFLNLKEFECHFAKYNSSGFYKKHLDQHQGSSERVVSAIIYLNQPKSGGELVIYKKDNPLEVDAKITPKSGSFVCFLSDQIYHEVLPTESERLSLTGWFRTSKRI